MKTNNLKLKYNNYNKRKWSYLLIIVMIAFVACNKYLDKKSNNKLVTPKTLSDLQAILDDEGSMNDKITPAYMQASTDEYFLSNEEYNSFDIEEQHMYLWSNYPLNITDDWSVDYHAVYNANLVLDLLKSIPISASNNKEWNNVKGSALFYRAYCFLELLWNYSKAFDSSTAKTDYGIVLRLTSDFNVKSVRTTNQECYEQIIKDTKEAIQLLPAVAQLATRPSKAAAYGLLARCYLSMRDYQDALLYADSSLQLNNQLMDYNGDPDVILDLNDNVPFKQYNKETLFFTETNTIYYIFCTSIIGSIDSSIIESYHTNDLRRTAFFSNNSNGYQSFKGPYCNSAYQLFSGIATDEMYLTRAECFIRNNQIQKGLDDLTTLLSKRYKTGTYTPDNKLSQEEALNLVISEREKELVMRDLRWMDLKRLNKEGRNIVLKRAVNNQSYTLGPNSNYYALPLPEDIIQLTGIPQNQP